MKTIALLSTLAFAALPVCAADLTAEVKAAAKKLSEKPNYSWATKSDAAAAQGGQGGGQRGRFSGFGTLPDGKTEKDGFTVLTFQAGENTTDVVRKGDKVAVKSGEEWKTADELANADDGGGGRGNRGQFMARRAQTVKLPSADAEELLGRVKELKKDGDTYTGDLTADGIKQMFTFGGGGRRPGGAGGNIPTPDTSGLKGTAKFWVKDGVLTKYETRVEGKMSFGQEGREREVNRTTTVEIRDIGTTKVEAPEAARKKLS